MNDTVLKKFNLQYQTKTVLVPGTVVPGTGRKKNNNNIIIKKSKNKQNKSGYRVYIKTCK